MSLSHVASREPASFTECVIGWDYSEPTHVIYDAREYTRNQARKAVSVEYDVDYIEAECRVAYCRWLSRQEIWDNGAGERWWDDQGEMIDGKWVPLDDGTTGPPAEPPADWQPDTERDAVFTFCDKGDPGAVKCWKVATGL